MVPAIYDPALADGEREVRHRGGLRHGAAPGARGRACWWASRRRPTSPPPSASPRELLDGGGRGAPVAATVVTVLADGAEKYLSEPFWEEVDR